MSWLSKFLHPEKGYDKAQEQLDKYYGQAQGNLQPYNKQGLDQYSNLNEFIKNLMDPQALQDQWAKGYTESESTKNAEGMAKEHGLDAASSMGLMGSSPALSAIQAGTTQIGLNDRQNYLDDLMQKYLAGAGLVQGAYGTGANAANAMSGNAMNMGQNSAEMAYGKENSQGNLFGNLLNTGLNLGSNYLTGGMGKGGYGRGSWSTGGG